VSETRTTTPSAAGGLGGRLRWLGSAFLLATSIWTGAAGGFGLYARQVGATRAWTAVAVAFAAIESGKLFVSRRAHSRHGHTGGKTPPKAPQPTTGAKPAGL
jgi:hypothetical protein